MGRPRVRRSVRMGRESVRLPTAGKQRADCSGRNERKELMMLELVKMKRR
jgi:hypothetical protein